MATLTPLSTPLSIDNSRPIRVCITGLTLTGNRGAEAMLLSIIDNIRTRSPGALFDVVSVYPEDDYASSLAQEVRIVSGKALTMLGVVLPISILLGPIAHIPVIRRIVKLQPVLHSFLAADIVLDCSGIAFVDGRGLPLLLYNATLCLPAALLGVPVAKLSQAMGPFKTRTNRCIASLVLPRLAAIIARGRITAEHLESLGVANSVVCADLAFAMPVSSAARKRAEEIIAEVSNGKPIVGIVPSVVVEDYCRTDHKDLTGILVGFIEHVAARGYTPLIIAHSTRPEGAGRKNNDGLICKEIREHLSPAISAGFVDYELDAATLRALIGGCTIVVASRFHSMVAALSECVPTLLIGWSHKYREVMEMFELTRWAIDFPSISLERLTHEFDQLTESSESVRSKLRAKLPDVIASATGNFDQIARILSQDISPEVFEARASNG